MDVSDSTRLLLSAAFLMTGFPSFSPAGASEAAPGGLRRSAAWGLRLAAADSGAEVRRVDPAGAAARAGLENDDRVLSIGSHRLTDQRSVIHALRALRAGDRAELEVARNGEIRMVHWTLPPLPLEDIPGCEVRYGSVRTRRGYRVRTILTRPARAEGRLPAILFVPWLSADPVEQPLGPGDGWMRLLHGLAQRSGWVTLRVEKPGVGDSEGPDCAENDLETDLDAFRAALGELAGMEGVDRSRLVLFGGSIGGALAPILAAERPVAGLIVAGGFSRTWFEHMLEIERERLTLSGVSPAEVNRALRGFAEFYALYLGARLTPGEVIARRPELAPLWYDAPDGQYGRSAAYFHQVAALNVEEAWSRIDRPVLILYGEYDWIMSRAEHERIAAIVNARRPGLATFEWLPRTDHNLEVYASREQAFHGGAAGFDAGLIERVSRWLEREVGSAPATAPR